jgi:lipopolysaccharide transport system ATP-binding protein
MNTVIRVDGLSKLYKIGIARHQYGTLRDHIAEGLKSILRINRESARHDEESLFWALQDVSFEIQEGDVVGVIGRNGAGKSTLLKILSRITKPTAGLVEIHGRVGSLLEVGTGFHPELTGRENIFLNGAILGMKKVEIERKFDEIVGFADIERFIDTPVKRYSSGMYVRLAFAVAAHLEPEVLLVDEVLAVGDAAFQKKCMGKMGDVAGQGRTVLFVSHNMAAIQHLCNKVILLDAGKVAFLGSANEVITYYLNRLPENSLVSSHITDLTSARGRHPKFHPTLSRLEMYSGGEPFRGSLNVGAPLDLRITFRLDHPTPNFCATVMFENSFGQRLLDISSYYHNMHFPADEQLPGDHTFYCDIPSLTLLPGHYSLTVFADIDGRPVDRVENAAHITVEKADYYGGGKLPEYGYTVVDHQWYHRPGLPEALTETGTGNFAESELHG